MPVLAKRAFVLISGQLQGLGFHDWLRARAEALGLRGGIRYPGRGRVEAIFTGEYEAVDEVLASLREAPSFAHLSDMKAHVELTLGSEECEGGLS